VFVGVVISVVVFDVVVSVIGDVGLWCGVCLLIGVVFVSVVFMVFVGWIDFVDLYFE